MSISVLVPLDGSELAERAIPSAFRLVSVANGRIVFAHARDPRARTKDADYDLIAVAERVRQDGVTVETCVVDLVPGEESDVIRRLARRLAPTEGLHRPGTVIVQIDGLAEPILRRALGEERMPTLASWLASGSHRLLGWDCDIPSMTTGSQAAILHGDNRDIPAFYWYEKRERRLMSSANPRDLHAVQRWISDGHGLLGNGGASVTNLFSGDAERTIMTVGTLIGDEGCLHAGPQDFYAYLLNPYNLYRGLAGLLGETIVECWQAARQKVENVRPRIRRFGLFTLQRGAVNVVMRDATTWAIVASMYRGRPVVYCDYLGYDEVAHYAGPETKDALGTLGSIDRQLARRPRGAAPVPRHRRLRSRPDDSRDFRVGVWQAAGRRRTRADRRGPHDGPGRRHARRVRVPQRLPERAGRRVGADGARRMMGMRAREQSIELPTERQRRARAASADVVLTSSGSLGHIYCAQVPDQLSLEQLAAANPGLFEALVAHEGIGFVLLRSETRGAIVLGKRGVRELDDGGALQGDDPLAGFSPHTGPFLRRLADYANAGDIVVNGAYDPSMRQIIGIDDLVAAHGGVGGMQTQPFLVYPSDWTDRDPELVGAAAVHHFLRRHGLGAETPHDRPTEASAPGRPGADSDERPARRRP